MKASLGFALVFACAASVPAQDAFVLATLQSSPSVAYEFRWLADDGSVTATLGRLPAGAFPVQVAIGPDNRSLRILARGPSPQRGSIFELAASGRLTTIASGPPIANPHMMFPGGDGDVYVVNDHGTSVELLRLAGGRLTPARTIRSITPTGCAIDPATGFVVLRGFERTTPATMGYFFLDPTTGNVTTVTTPQLYSIAGSSRIGFDAVADEFVDLRQDFSTRTVTMMRFDRTRGVTSLRPVLVDPQASPIDLVAASSGGQLTRHWALVRTTFAGTYLLGLRADGAPIRAAQLSGLAGSPLKLVRAASEPIGVSLANAPNDRTVHLRFPGEGGKSYALVASASGYRPGPRLPDGRMVPVVPDSLTFASLRGGIPGVLTPTVGVLDAQGDARVRVNANPFPGVGGVRIWVAALVFDRCAPSGVADVAGPYGITMR